MVMVHLGHVQRIIAAIGDEPPQINEPKLRVGTRLPARQAVDLVVVHVAPGEVHNGRPEVSGNEPEVPLCCAVAALTSRLLKEL